MKTIQQVIDANGGLDRLTTLTVEQPGYFPLIIERNGDHVTVGFYSTDADGEMHADPEVTFLVQGQTWTPVMLTVGDYREHGTTPSLKRFCRKWDERLFRDEFTLATAQ